MTNTAAVQTPSDYPNAPADYNAVNAALDALDDLLIDAQQQARKGAPRYQILDQLAALQAGVNAAINQAKAI
jgi:hypothetical protein